MNKRSNNQVLRIALIIIGGVFLFSFIMCLGIGGFLVSDDSEIKTENNNTLSEKTTEKSTEKTAKQIVKATPKATEEIIAKIEASKLIKDYEANEIAADKKYKNKKYEITGKVNQISEVLGIFTVSLSDEEYAIVSVSLRLKESDKDVVANLNKGDEVTVIGTIKGKGWDVDVKDVKFKHK